MLGPLLWNNIDALTRFVCFGPLLWNNIDAFAGGAAEFEILVII